MGKKRNIRFTYQVLNIKLISNTRKGTDAYRQLLEAIFSSTITKPTTKGKEVILRTMFPTENYGNKFFYGKISRYTKLENTDWLNLATKQIESPEIDKNLFPNLQETEYIFVPQAHRFIIKKSPNFTIFNAKDFFEKAIKEVIDFDEDYSVVIEQSKDIFEQIFNARKVENLSITITYTNSDDISDDAVEWMDELLKLSLANETKLSFKGDKAEGLNIKTDLIKGALGLAVENGEATALIHDDNNRRTKIITKNHPQEVKSEATSEDEVKFVMFTEIMNKYRNNEINER